jgi:glycosyltransferase involved in cell wall biosynthesis
MRISDPLISIILSVYNHQDYVGHAIESIIGQTYDNLEFIIINDGSTDDSLKIIQKYEALDSRIIVLNQENSGLTKALNAGIKKSSGEYIARQDADDKSLPNRLEKQLDIIEKYGLDIVTSRAVKDNKIVPNSFIYQFNRSSILKTGNIFIHGTFFMRRNVFNFQMYDESFKYAQDFKFILDACNNNFKIGISIEPMYYLSNIETSISNTKKEEQDKFISDSLVEFFGTDRYFIYLSKLNRYFYKLFKIILIIFIFISTKGHKFKIIK